MNTADNEEQRGYFYSCISKHLQSVITRNTPTGASIFKEEGQLNESGFEGLAREFHKKYPISTCHYELFMMRQPKGKTMSHYISTLLVAADIANINTLTPDKLLITLTLATCTDNALKQEWIKLEAGTMKETQDEVNMWETRMNTASRMLNEKQQRAQQARMPRNSSNKTDTRILHATAAGARTNRTSAKLSVKT